MDVIRAKTDKAMHNAVRQLDGSLSQLINDTRQEILNTLAQVEVNIDYPEYDDVEEATTELVREKTLQFQALWKISSELPAVEKSCVKASQPPLSVVQMWENPACSITSSAKKKPSLQTSQEQHATLSKNTSTSKVSPQAD